MMLLNKERRINYLGFNDFWFTVVGVIIISFITDYLFSKSFVRYPFGIAVMSWSVSLFFTICDWFIIRSVLIFLRKKYPDFQDDIKRIIIFFLSIILTVIAVDYVGGYLIVKIFNLFGESANHELKIRILLPVTLITIMTMAIYEAVYYYARLKKSIREEEQSKQIIIQAKLDTLRNQARPHFLFNSLNTLRDIIDQDDKEDAKAFVDNLANVYRFILESGNTNLISLQKELKFVKAYVHIQKERFGENLRIEWSIPESKLESMIVPMSLQLLIENAIKHNVVSKAKPLIIKVEIDNNNLMVSNQIQVKSTQIPSTKIGLKNIEKRYALISHKLPIVKKEENHFIVFLPLLRLSDQKKNYANTNN